MRRWRAFRRQWCSIRFLCSLAPCAGSSFITPDRDLEAVEQFNATLGMESRFWIGQICAAKVYEKLGMHSEALVACDLAWQFSGGNSEALSLAGYVNAVAGNKAKAEEYIHQMLERRKERYVPRL